MVRFRENKMAAQNFKKSFLTEVLQLPSSNSVRTCIIRYMIPRPKGGAMRPEMDLWRIFKRPSENVVFASLAELVWANRK